MTRAVCFTQTLDGFVNCAYGDFGWRAPRVSRHSVERFAAVIHSSYAGLHGDEVDRVLAHAAKPGCASAIVVNRGAPAVAVLIKARDDEGAPPHPERWVWQSLKRGFDGAK